MGDVVLGAGDPISLSGESRVCPVMAGEGGRLVLIAGVGGIKIEDAPDGGPDGDAGKGLMPC